MTYWDTVKDEAFPLATTKEILLALPVADAIIEAKMPECWHYAEIFFTKAEQADSNGDVEIGKAWRLLYELCRAEMRPDDLAVPFSPIPDPEGGWLSPSDMDTTTANAVRALGFESGNPELRARLLDITWESCRDANAAREAVKAYVDAANQLFDPERWRGYVERVERAARLAVKIKDNDLRDFVLSEIEQRVVALDGSDLCYMTSRLMELLYEFQKGDPEAMSRIAGKAGQARLNAGDFVQARAHFENLRCWRYRLKDKDGEREARIAIARSYEMEADRYAGEGNALRICHLLEHAHQAYRNIPEMRDEAKRVYARLRKAQQHALKEMYAIQGESIDLSASIEAARKYVGGKCLKRALLSLAMVVRPTDFNHETDTARRMVERFPLQNLFGGKRITDDGRIVAPKTPAIAVPLEQAEKALWERVVEQVCLLYAFKAQVKILPALHQLTFEHSPSLRDMRDLVIQNPFVPPGHEEIFAKGFLAGLREDFPEALSILVPQLENSLRHLLSIEGVEITKKDKMGIQNVIQMGTILAKGEGGCQDQLENILGPDNVKELKVLFDDPHGVNLRNRIAHGMMADDDFFGVSAIYAWWFIVHLCINPVCRRFAVES